MTQEELLIPRYEVIADYPGNDLKVGEVFQPNSDWPETYLNKYPHLFRPLQWWEKRKVEDMPEYVKFEDEILLVHYSVNMDGSLFLHAENISFSVGNRYYPITPATEQEYIDYQKSITP